MFELVGGIGHLNQHCVPLRVAGLDILLDTGQPHGRGAGAPDPPEAQAAGLAKDLPLLEMIRDFDPAPLSRPSPAEHRTIALVSVKNGAFRLEWMLLRQGGRQTYFRYEAASQRFSRMEVFNHLPPLRIAGDKICRGDTGEPVVFKGISLFYQKGPQGEDILSMVRRNLAADERLGLPSNLLRLSYYSHEVGPGDLPKFAELADYLSSQGCYLALTPHNVQVDAEGTYVASTRNGERVHPNYYLPGGRDLSVLSGLAGLLHMRTNVIYGIWNEPANTTWPEFSRTIAAASDGIYSHFHDPGTRPLLLVPGMDWSRDFREAMIPLAPGSYLVDVHEYPLRRRNNIYYRYRGMIGQAPVLISEMGGSVSADYRPQSLEDIGRMRRILFDVVNGPALLGSIHYCIWKGDDSPDGIREPGGGLSPRGRMVLAERAAFPTQYDFRLGRSLEPAGWRPPPSSILPYTALFWMSPWGVAGVLLLAGGLAVGAAWRRSRVQASALRPGPERSPAEL